jgi:hypothetical protein
MADITKPSPQEVQDFHSNADADGGRRSMHHTLGPRAQQASPGDHTHDGGDSKLLLDGVIITGAKGGNTALASVILALVGLGATDSTTA